MKKYIKLSYLLAVVSLFAACVDDYEDANPAPLLDAPIGSLSPSASAPTNSKKQIVLEGGEEATVSISIFDAPGKLDSISWETTRGGEVTSTTFDNLKGQETGTFDVTFKAPTNLDGVTTLNISVYDAQVDEDGEASPKSYTFSQSFDVSYAFNAPSMEITIPDGPLYKGGTKDITVNVTGAPGGGIDTLLASVLSGTLDVNQADLQALMGKETGQVRMTYTAPDDEVGEFIVTLFATDILQNRSTTLRDTITVEYQYPAPDATLDLTGLNLNNGFVTVPLNQTIKFKVDLGAGKIGGDDGVASITGEVVASNPDITSVGTLTIGDIVTDAGQSTAEVSYKAPRNNEGFYTINISVTNGEGNTTELTQKVAVFKP